MVFTESMETFAAIVHAQKQKGMSPWRYPGISQQSVEELLAAAPPGAFDDAEQEQFDDKKSLVEDNKYGCGPIRHIDIDGVCYHGLNNYSSKLEQDESIHFSKAKDLTAKDFKHCIFQAERYKDKPYYRQWDTHDAHQFCSNCVIDKELSKGRRTLTVYRCLGH